MKRISTVKRLLLGMFVGAVALMSVLLVQPTSALAQEPDQTPVEHVYTFLFAQELDSLQAVERKTEEILKVHHIANKPIAHYVHVFKGFSISLTPEQATLLNSEVGKAFIQAGYQDQFYPAPVRTVGTDRDATSNTLISANTLPEKYDGRGRFVAIVDSGGTPTHPDMRLSSSDIPKKIASEEAANALIAQKGLRGKWFSDKIPYGYNYANNDQDISGNQDNHGTHVAGIVAANPLNADGHSRGVIPNAQIAVMRVFGRGSKGTGSHIYVRAVEDALNLGVDSINMSLGSAVGQKAAEDDIFVRALNKAKEKGIIIAIAGGNDGLFGNTNPSVDNPDYGVLGSPGVEPLALTVASVENTKAMMQAMIIEDTTVSPEIVNHFIKHLNSTTWNITEEVKHQFVYCGLGKPENFADKNVTGKIALVDRGEITFVEKIKNAQNAGATMVIVANSQAAGDDLVGMVTEGTTIPSTMISRRDGDFLIAHPNATIEPLKDPILVDNNMAGRISSFSSWGLTADGDLKPDVTAPGGSIYSTIPTGHESENGTSMATPHVAAVLALMQQRFDEEFPTITGKERYAIIKNLMMSTALPHTNPDSNVFSSPRQQGAGIINASSAVLAKVYVSGPSGVASQNLGSIRENTVRVSFTLHNLSTAPITYTSKVHLSTDTVENGHFLVKPHSLGEFSGPTLTVPASGSVEGHYDIDVSQLTFPTTKLGNYLDGFVVFENVDEPKLSFPFSGFVGDWANLPVLEPLVNELLQEGKEPTYITPQQKADVLKSDANQHNWGGPVYTFTHFATTDRGEKQVLGALPGLNPQPYYSKDHLAISPNGDRVFDSFEFKGTFWRNYQSFIIRVVNDKGEEVFKNQSYGGLKNYINSDDKSATTGLYAWKWDGLKRKGFLSTEPVPDGTYTVELISRPVAEGAQAQTVSYKVAVDRVAPDVKTSTYNADTKTFVLKKIDEAGSGIRQVFVVNGQGEVINPVRTDTTALSQAELSLKPVAELTDLSFTLPSDANPDDYSLVMQDWAHNVYKKKLMDSVLDPSKASVRVQATAQGEFAKVPEFTTTIYDENNTEVQPDALEFGKSYTLEVDFDDTENYELTNEVPIVFMPTTEDPHVVVNLVFKKIVYTTVKANVVVVDAESKHTYPGEPKISIVNKATGKVYDLAYTATTTHSKAEGRVPVGDYLIQVSDVAAGWSYSLDKTEVTITGAFMEFGFAGNAFTVTYTKNPAPVEAIQVRLTEAENSLYKEYSADKPLVFVFTNAKTNAVTEHVLDGTEASKTLTIDSGTYSLAVKGAPAHVRFALVGQDAKNFDLEKNATGPTELTFSFVEPEEVTVMLHEQTDTEYTEHSEENPVVFVFTNLDSKAVVRKEFSQTNKQVKLRAGRYSVVVERPENYTVELYQKDATNFVVEPPQYAPFVTLSFKLVQAEEQTPQVPTYTIVEGNNLAVVRNAGVTARFKSDAPFAEFDHVKVDGVVVEQTNYTATEGSTIVELNEAYLKTLAVGEHTLELVFKDGGVASTKFTVQDPAVVDPVDPTEPEVPGNPTDPEVPGNPAEPQPENPQPGTDPEPGTDPVDPEDPQPGVDPVPGGDPVDPQDPAKPGEGDVDSSKKNSPSDGSQTVVKPVVKPVVADTSDPLMAYAGMSLIGALSMGGAFLYRKKQ